MPHKILIVDDETAVVELLAYNLRKAHYDVLVATDGPSALQQAHVSQPDLIVLDLMLPGLDGFEVCRELRKTSTVPIIMLTAQSEGPGLARPARGSRVRRGLPGSACGPPLQRRADSAN